jgi:hypothetical protein
LLSNYDEYLISYRDRELFVDNHPARAIRNDALAAHFIMLDGRIVGGWRRNVAQNGVSVRADLFTKLHTGAFNDLKLEFERYSRFLGIKVEVEFKVAI